MSSIGIGGEYIVEHMPKESFKLVRSALLVSKKVVHTTSNNMAITSEPPSMYVLLSRVMG